LEYSFQRQIDHGWTIVVIFPFQNGEIRFDRHRIWEHCCQHVAKLAQLIERDTNLVPHLSERHHVLVQIHDLFDVLVVVVPLDHVALLGLDLVDLLFGLEVIKRRPIHI
jgi:hypothetical protein